VEWVEPLPGCPARSADRRPVARGGRQASEGRDSLRQLRPHVAGWRVAGRRTRGIRPRLAGDRSLIRDPLPRRGEDSRRLHRGGPALHPREPALRRDHRGGQRQPRRLAGDRSPLRRPRGADFGPRLRTGPPGRIRGRPWPLPDHGRRGPELRLRRDHALRGEAPRRVRRGDGLALQGSDPAGSHALEPSLDREPPPELARAPPLPSARLRLPLWTPRAHEERLPGDAAPHLGHGVRERAGGQGGRAGHEDHGGPDRPTCKPGATGGATSDS